MSEPLESDETLQCRRKFVSSRQSARLLQRRPDRRQRLVSPFSPSSGSTSLRHLLVARPPPALAAHRHHAALRTRSTAFTRDQQIGRHPNHDASGPYLRPRYRQRHHARPHLLPDRLREPFQVARRRFPHVASGQRDAVDLLHRGRGSAGDRGAACFRRSAIAQVASMRRRSSCIAMIRSGTSAGAARSTPAASFNRLWDSSTNASWPWRRSPPSPILGARRRPPPGLLETIREVADIFRSAAHACRRGSSITTVPDFVTLAEPLGNDPNLFAVFLPEQRHRSGFHRRLGSHQPCRDLGVFRVMRERSLPPQPG